MDFISLGEVIKNMVECVIGPEDDLYSDAAFTKAKRYSDAAADLHRELHNNNETRPQWVAISDATEQPLINDAVSIEGMGILEHMAGWHERLVTGHLKYLAECESAEKAGIDVSRHRPSIKLGNGQYTRQGILKAHRIGFNRAELTAFLAAHNIVDPGLITPDIENKLQSDNQPQKPISRQRAQEEAILLAIKNEGHNPQSLPKNKPGIAGIKAEMWGVLKEEQSIFQSRGVFDKAWQRLREEKRIIN